MGMFDSIYAECPKCHSELEFQTKGRLCEGARYHCSSVPIGAADGVYRSETCKECGAEVSLKVDQERVEMMAYVENCDKEWN